MYDERANILFPIETFSRELDFRLVLASLFSSSKRRIFVGHHDAMKFAVEMCGATGGLYVGKQVFEPRVLASDEYQYFKERGFHLVHLDEEGGVFPGDSNAWKRALNSRLNPRLLDGNDRICCWGDFQARHYREKSAESFHENVIVTGHPRFDLYSEKYRGLFNNTVECGVYADEEFVLINTNFGWANNGAGLASIFSSGRGYSKDDRVGREHVVGQWAHQHIVLGAFVKLINSLSSAFPHIRFVVRPHTSESAEFYRIVTSAFPNVDVVRSGSVAPWLVSAKALIHDGCTTAIESFLLKTPVIRYAPFESAKFSLSVPNSVGVRCQTELDVISQLRGVLHGELPASNGGDALSQVIYNIAGTHASFPRLVDVMSDAVLDDCNRSPNIELVSFFEKARIVKQQSKFAARIFSPKRRAGYRYFREKFVGFNEADIRERMEKIKKINNVEVRWRLVSEYLLIVE